MSVRGARSRPAGVREVLRVREFRALLGSSALSITGDQVARIAVALLVYRRTGSPLAAAATYACSYLTWLAGGLVLSALADRLHRRRLMVACDLLRAAAVATLLVHRPPLALVFAVLLVVGVLSPPFDAAKSAVLPEVLAGDLYAVGNGLQSGLFQAANALGFLLGGALVAGIGVRWALAVDVASFVLSAALLRGGLVDRPTPQSAGGSLLAETAAGVTLVAHDPVLRRWLALGLLGALALIAPEGLAVPVAAALHTGPGARAEAAGVLTAAGPTGFLAGSFVLLRRSPARREELLPWLGVLSGVALALTPLAGHAPAGPVVLLTALLWAAAGAGAALLLVANAAYMQAVPAHMRARAFGVASTTLMGVQGGLLLALGGLAELVGPRTAVALAGAVALVAVALLAAAPQGAHADRPGADR